MVVDNLNENHHKVIEFMILRRKEGWQYHQDILKKGRLQQTERIGSHTSWECVLCRQECRRPGSYQERLYKGLKPYWTLLSVLKWLKWQASSTGEQGMHGSVYDLHVHASNHEEKTSNTAREALFLIFSHHQSCSESCFLFDCQIVSQKLGTRKRECKLSYKRILDNKNYINGLKVRGNCMKYISVTFWETGKTQHGECPIATIVSCLQPGEEWTKE